jgi:hypothetical protein
LARVALNTHHDIDPVVSSEALSREAAAAAQSREAAAISSQLVAEHAAALATEQQRFTALESRHAGASVELGARAAEIASLKAQVPCTYQLLQRDVWSFMAARQLQ